MCLLPSLQRAPYTPQTLHCQPLKLKVNTSHWSDRTHIDSNLKPKHRPLDHRPDFQNSCSGDTRMLSLWHIARNTDVYYMTETCKFVSFSKPIYHYTFEMSSVGQLCPSCELYAYLAFCQTICTLCTCNGVFHETVVTKLILFCDTNELRYELYVYCAYFIHHSYIV